MNNGGRALVATGGARLQVASGGRIGVLAGAAKALWPARTAWGAKGLAALLGAITARQLVVKGYEPPQSVEGDHRLPAAASPCW